MGPTGMRRENVEQRAFPSVTHPPTTRGTWPATAAIAKTTRGAFIDRRHSFQWSARDPVAMGRTWLLAAKVTAATTVPRGDSNESEHQPIATTNCDTLLRTVMQGHRTLPVRAERRTWLQVPRNGKAKHADHCGRMLNQLNEPPETDLSGLMRPGVLLQHLGFATNI